MSEREKSALLREAHRLAEAHGFVLELMNACVDSRAHYRCSDPATLRSVDWWPLSTRRTAYIGRIRRTVTDVDAVKLMALLSNLEGDT